MKGYNKRKQSNADSSHSEDEEYQQNDSDSEGGFADDSDGSQESSDALGELHLNRLESKLLSKKYPYICLEGSKIKAVIIQKLNEITEMFEYANLNDFIIWKIFKDHDFVSIDTKNYIQEHIMSLMENYAKKEPEGELNPDGQKEYMCNLCYMPCEDESQAKHYQCGHVFCKECIEGYIEQKVNEGPGVALESKCAFDGCKFGISIDIVDDCGNEQTRQMFDKFFIDSFVDTAPYTSFCLATDCNNCFLVDEKYLSDNNNVAQQNGICKCGTPVCLRCKGISHEPLSCLKFKSWDDSLNKIMDSLNYLWKLSNTKKCPGCSTHIQKNEGCNYMECYKCQLGFCWFCLKPWSQHEQRHTWEPTCNVYVEKKTEEDLNEEDKLKKMEFYFERFKGHKMSYELNDQRTKKHIKIIDTEETFREINKRV